MRYLGLVHLGSSALVLMASAAVARAAPADELPDRWRDGVGLGDDRTGDLRPEAAALLDRIAAAGPAGFTVGDARALGLVGPATRARRAPVLVGGQAVATTAVAFEPPATIRVWRRALDGSTASCDGRVDVIPFETYVKGVLPHEWIRSWHAEALAAGGVAIRTYAAAWVEAGGKYTCADLDDTTASQVYRDNFYPESDAAVDATAGVFVIRDGELVFAEYSAENGDPTAFGVAEPLCAGQTRNGHGRGTCQWGTQRWANDGQTWDWMMAHYYPGAAAVGGWAASPTGQQFEATIESGDEMAVSLDYRNDGPLAWPGGQVQIGTTGPRDRDSVFYRDGWLSPARPAALATDVAPGETGQFAWTMVAPEVTEPTVFVESFALVTSDGWWFGPSDGPGDDTVTWTITVVPRGWGGDASGGCRAGGDGGPGGGGVAVVGCAILVGVARRRRRRAG